MRVNNKEHLEHNLGKLPPQAVEVELAVLGAILLEKDAMYQVSDILKPESFYQDINGVIYEACVSLFVEGKPIDLQTVKNQLKKSGNLEYVGGAYHLAEITSKISSAANIEHHARIINEMAIKRDLIRNASEITYEAYEDTTDAFELLEKQSSSVFKIFENNTKRGFKAVTQLVHESIKQTKARGQSEKSVNGVPSGFNDLDDITGGWQNSDLVIIAARPGVGKTGLICCAANNAAKLNLPIAIFSLEMSSVQLVDRLLSAESEIPLAYIRKGIRNQGDIMKIESAGSKISNLYIDDTPSLSILELRAKAMRLKTQHDIKMIIVDYLQLMADTGTKKVYNREQEIAAISRSLKSLAKELDIPVIALSQLNRTVETRGGDKRPQLSDLRESGSLEQDADMVIFLYRPEYYGILEDHNGKSIAGMAELIIAKHRNGALSSVWLKFIGKFTKFVNLNEEKKTYDNPHEPRFDFDKVNNDIEEKAPF